MHVVLGVAHEVGSVGLSTLSSQREIAFPVTRTQSHGIRLLLFRSDIIIGDANDNDIGGNNGVSIIQF